MEPLKSVSSLVENIPEAKVSANATGVGAAEPPPPPPPHDTRRKTRRKLRCFIQKIITHSKKKGA